VLDPDITELGSAHRKSLEVPRDHFHLSMEHLGRMNDAAERVRLRRGIVLHRVWYIIIAALSVTRKPGGWAQEAAAKSVDALQNS
jgi:hypothetical protein